MFQIMGQLFSNLWRWVCPKAKNETQPNHYQTFYVDDINEKQPPPQSQCINVSDHDHIRPISGSSNRNCHNFGSAVAPHTVVQFSKPNDDDQDAKTKLKSEEQSICYVDDLVTFEKNVTTLLIKYLSSVITDVVVRTLGPYTSAQRILLVGEGDFSFSASLAVAFGTSNLNIVATSLNSEDFLVKNYRRFLKNKAKLENRGSMVIHGVDATKMAKHPVLGRMVFDRIIFNFPHIGKFDKSNSVMGLHQKLVAVFLRNAKKMILEDGEIHITSKSNGFFLKWNIPKLGSDQGLDLIQEVKFKRSKYPGYQTKFGFRGDKNFHCYPSKTYKFALSDK